jgi:hypothetical protein
LTSEPRGTPAPPRGPASHPESLSACQKSYFRHTSRTFILAGRLRERTVRFAEWEISPDKLDLSTYKNDYQAAVKTLVDANRKGKPLPEPEPEPAKTKVVNFRKRRRHCGGAGPPNAAAISFAFTAKLKTQVVRGWERLFEVLTAAGKPDILDDPSGKPATSESGEDWADRPTRKLAVFGFLPLALGFALDLYSKVAGNPSLLK